MSFLALDIETANFSYEIGGWDKTSMFEPTVVETDTEFRVDTFSVKCVPVETAKMYEKAIKSGKVCKAYTSLR